MFVQVMVSEFIVIHLFRLRIVFGISDGISDVIKFVCMVARILGEKNHCWIFKKKKKERKITKWIKEISNTLVPFVPLLLQSLKNLNGVRKSISFIHHFFKRHSFTIFIFFINATKNRHQFLAMTTHIGGNKFKNEIVPIFPTNIVM